MLREDKVSTPDEWRRIMARWPWLLGLALVEVAIGAAMVVVDRSFGVPSLGLVAVVLAFQAGQMKAEHDRLRGRDRVLGRRRPPGG